MADYNDIVKQEWERFENSPHYPNIMLLGCTGCGKSSLINTVFGRNVATINNASRGTTDFDVYLGKENNSTVNLIDSMGYEMGSATDSQLYIENFRSWISKNDSTDRKVHLIWYCISVNSHRAQEFDVDILNAICQDAELRKKLAVIITQCDQDDDKGSGAAAIRDVIHEDVSRALPVFEVSNDPKLPLELNALVEWSANNISNEDIRKMFIASQMIDLQAKRKTAAIIITSATVAAGATGAIPIPVADAPILTAEQVAMAAGIIGCYGLNMAKGTVTALVGDILVSNLGKTIVGSLLKLFPGIGTVAGAAINGGVAATITAALGVAISEICYASCKKIAQGETVLLNDCFDANTIKSTVNTFINANKGKSIQDLKNIIEAEGEEKD